MNKMKKILAPTDFSELSQAGIRHALNLARDLGAEVTVYHVVSQEELIRYSKEIREKLAYASPLPSGDQLLEKYEEALDRFLRDHFSDLLSGVTIRRKVEFGEPYRNIVDEAEKEGVDWIVISTHGRTGLSHALMGSVTEKVVRYAPCPVLSVHPEMVKEAVEHP
jgi:nucleotide-binding universal stress UspA family protein